MSNYKNKTAIISGGAEGIGLSIAKAFGQQGMNIVIGDINEAQLHKAEAELADLGIAVLAVTMDVTNIEHWQDAARSAVERFGKIHMLVNNAGVSSNPGPLEKTKHQEWQWVLDVNLMGVIMGAETMVPHIKEHGEGGWVINVASMAGMIGVPYAGAYTATKVAVVGMSEAWRVELKNHNIEVSVLCPAFVQTRIHLSHRNKQDRYKSSSVTATAQKPSKAKHKENPAQALVENGIPVELVGQRVVEALDAGEFYIFTHPGQRKVVQQRFAAIDQAFERAEKSPLLADINDPEIPIFNPK